MNEGNDRGFEYLPNDLLDKILRRIPAEQLWWRCRLVCTRWKSLVSSPSFAHAHLQQSPPTFFVSKHRGGKQKVDLFYPRDDDAKRAFDGLFQRWNHRMRGDIVLPVASCNGLVLFQSFSCGSAEFHIGNPITGEILTLKAPSYGNELEMTIHFFGFFFHSSTQEYKLLFYHRTDRPSTKNRFGYAMVMHTLGSAKWRSLRAPLYDVWCSSQPLVVVDNTLYWMFPNLSCENSILMFSMDSEEFRTISHPKYPCKPGDTHQWIRLLEMDGRLTCWCWVVGLMVQECFFEVFVFDTVDHVGAHTHWTRIYVLDLTQTFGSYMSHTVRDFYNLKLGSIQNRELLLF
ncbi:hypothetical protein V6N13_014405 [Hibiscus sabdariffa]|uniref:F-box domain-containing protein n=1 Tax=Hibiscus sabdariffa TaxID=183260 RepID=A0ABR2RVQ8_9ROSI